MAQWGSTDNAANSVNWAGATVRAGSGQTAKSSNNTALYGNVTPSSFITNRVVGQFGVSVTEMSVAGEGKKAHAPGWHLRRAGLGPVVSITVSNGVGFANGETLNISNGSSNASVSLTTNATGNLVSGSIVTGGLFPNTSVFVYTFTREKHLNNITVGGTPTGYTNTDYILASNGTTNGVATVITNSTGGFVTANLTLTNVGLWAAATSNTNVVIVAYAANGAASNGSGATFTANLVASSGGSANAVLGGRAGRVHYECLAVVKNITDGTSDDANLPNS